MSFTEDTGNLAVALTCVHPQWKIEFTGMAFSFRILNIFKGRQKALFERPVETRGSGKKRGLLLSQSSSTLQLTWAVVGMWRPLSHILLPCWRQQGQCNGQVPSGHSENLPCWENPQQETAMYFLLVQSMKWCWHRSQIRVEGLPQPLIF